MERDKPLACLWARAQMSDTEAWIFHPPCSQRSRPAPVLPDSGDFSQTRSLLWEQGSAWFYSSSPDDLPKVISFSSHWFSSALLSLRNRRRAFPSYPTPRPTAQPSEIRHPFCPLFNELNAAGGSTFTTVASGRAAVHSLTSIDIHKCSK